MSKFERREIYTNSFFRTSHCNALAQTQYFQAELFQAELFLGHFQHDYFFYSATQAQVHRFLTNIKLCIYTFDEILNSSYQLKIQILTAAKDKSSTVIYITSFHNLCTN